MVNVLGYPAGHTLLIPFLIRVKLFRCITESRVYSIFLSTVNRRLSSRQSLMPIKARQTESARRSLFMLLCLSAGIWLP